VARLSLAPASAVDAPPGLQTFAPGSSQDTTLTFTNTTGVPAMAVKLSIAAPKGWTSAATASTPATIAGPVAPGASVSATFKVTSGPVAFNGDLAGNASWTAKGSTQSETSIEKVRNVSPIKINEFRVSDGSTTNSTNSFIELYNAGGSAVDLSNWSLTQHPTQQAIFSSVKIPAGTKLAARGFYLLGLSNSGLAAPARAGDTTIHVRSTAGMNVGDTVEIDTGAGVETRKIASLGTAAGIITTVWQPVPDGPVITIPAGSTNVPVTGPGGRGGGDLTGIEVGQKIGIGYGATYPTVAKAVEKYEVVTVTAMGKPGTQAWLTASAKAGDTNIKVSSLANISPGDKIRLDIDSMGHGIETVTVTKVGTQSVRNAFNGPLKDTELGTGLDLAAPLKFNHSSNISFSSRGTGITFQPATTFAHSSNEPVQPLGTGITLDKPLVKAHAIDAVVRDGSVTTAGYQGTPAPNQWFGGPALSTNAGSMVLRDGAGLVVDSLNYGGLVDPWAAEGYHGKSGAGESGCRVPIPNAGRGGGGPNAPAMSTPNRSLGRFPDGADTDSNCTDFLSQTASTLAAASQAGTNNIKVASVANFGSGQSIMIDTGAKLETAVIATVGTGGATTVSTATEAGATVIPVAIGAGFTAGQTITIDSGGNRETVTVASTTGGGRGGRGGPGAGATITVTAPLKSAHAVGAQVSGSGITLTSALTKTHESGAQVAGNVPTPGAPNQYSRRPN